MEDGPVFKPLQSQRSVLTRCLYPRTASPSRRSRAKQTTKGAAKTKQAGGPAMKGAEAPKIQGHPGDAKAKDGFLIPAIKGDPESLCSEAKHLSKQESKKDASHLQTQAQSKKTSFELKKRSSMVRGGQEEGEGSSHKSSMISLVPRKDSASTTHQEYQESSRLDQNSEPARKDSQTSSQCNSIGSRERPDFRQMIKNLSGSKKLAKDVLGDDFEATDFKQQAIIKGEKKAGQNASKELKDKNRVVMTSEEEGEYMAQLAKVKLRGVNNEVIRAGTLWQESPVLLLLLRRPGCIMCRTESLKLEQVADRLDALGVRRVAIVFEWLELEVEEYKKFWSGEIFLDPGREFYKALSGGEAKTGSVVGVTVNPMSRYWKNFTAAKIILKDQPYSWKEEVFGDPLRVKLILDECTLAAESKSPSQSIANSPATSIQSSATKTFKPANSDPPDIGTVLPARLEKPHSSDSLVQGISLATLPTEVKEEVSEFHHERRPKILESSNKAPGQGLLLVHAHPPTFQPSAAAVRSFAPRLSMQPASPSLGQAATARRMSLQPMHSRQSFEQGKQSVSPPKLAQGSLDTAAHINTSSHV